jgi:hypothetical protein
MTEPCETDVRRNLFTSKRTSALLEPTTQLARMLTGRRASLLKTRLRSFSQPELGLCSHGSRQTSGEPVDEPGGSLYATPPLSR